MKEYTAILSTIHIIIFEALFYDRIHVIEMNDDSIFIG